MVSGQYLRVLSAKGRREDSIAALGWELQTPGEWIAPTELPS